jgi:hypothetical protein
MPDWLFSYLPKAEILAALGRSPGNEIGSGKLASAGSSAALAVNAFGFFLDQPDSLPAIPGTDDFGWPARSVTIEHSCRFPWSGGHHPWLDAFVETRTHIIGIESKRYEPFRGKTVGQFSKAYWRDVWGPNMAGYEGMRDDVAAGALSNVHLDAAQLVKHALGLRTEARRRARRPALVYLHAEPATWPDGRLVSADAKQAHRAEIAAFCERVQDDDVAFHACTYTQLINEWARAGSNNLRRHAAAIETAFLRAA